MSPSIRGHGSFASSNSRPSRAEFQWPLSKKGELKRRLNLEEKLRILDPSADPELTRSRLGIFMNLFAFRRETGGIITRARGGHRDWTKLRGPILEDHVIRHLLADRLLPIFNPQWIGARSVSTTYYACLDVDPDRFPARRLTRAHSLDEIAARGYQDIQTYVADLLAEKESLRRKPCFAERSLRVETAFRAMGINPDDPYQVLKLASPSGGRHYYIFFEGPHFLHQVYGLFTSAGLRDIKSQIEFFPDTKIGLRLPFGYVPGQNTNHQAWIDFIVDYAKGRIRRHSIGQLYAELYETRNRDLDQATNSSQGFKQSSRQGRSRRDQATAVLGLPRAALKQASQPTSSVDLKSSKIERYHDLVERGPSSFQEAEELLSLGIKVEGTRVAVLKHLVVHFIWFRNHTAEQAAEHLTRWSMNSRHQSKDIQSDLAHGTRIVVKQIIKLCQWYAAKKQTAGSSGSGIASSPCFARAELNALSPLIQSLSEPERANQARFLLHMLWFAKRHGKALVDKSGWEVSVAINAVVRKWPGCQGKNYYKFRMDRAKQAGLLTMIKEKRQLPGRKGRARTYRLAVPVIEGQDSAIGYTAALSELISTSVNPEDRGLQVIIDESTPRSLCNDRITENTGLPVQKLVEDPCPKPLHPGSAGGSLGTCPSQCSTQSTPLEELPHQSDEGVSAISPTVVQVSASGESGRNGLSDTCSQPNDIMRNVASSAMRSQALLQSLLLEIQSDPVLRLRMGSLLSEPSDSLSPQETSSRIEFLVRCLRRRPAPSPSMSFNRCDVSEFIRSERLRYGYG
jgi:hypothetical protein